MAKFAVYNSSLGTAAARPVVDDFDVDDLPEDTFAARLADAVSDIPGGFGYIQLTAGTYFSDLDGDASTYDYTVDTRGAPDAPPPVDLDPVVVDRYSLEEKQSQVKNRRDLLLLESLQLLAGDRLLTETDLGAVSTYLAALRAIPDAPASPDTVLFPTLAALANNASANLLARSYRRGNVVGGVSMSGGLPNGALFETTTTIDGLILRTADGSQLCATHISAGYFSSGVLTTAWDFPGSFISTAAVRPIAFLSTVNASNVASGLAANYIRQVQAFKSAHTATSATFQVRPTGGLTFSPGDSCFLVAFAFGRWTT
jgi:hypothetical protein